MISHENLKMQYEYVDNLDQTGQISNSLCAWATIIWIAMNSSIFFFYKHNYLLRKVSVTVEFLAKKLFSHDKL
jgi:hypothetical protein